MFSNKPVPTQPIPDSVLRSSERRAADGRTNTRGAAVPLLFVDWVGQLMELCSFKETRLNGAQKRKPEMTIPITLDVWCVAN